MKKFFSALVLLLIFGLPAHATITVTLAGTAGTNNSGVNTLTTTAYNQAAGHCMVITSNAFNQAPGSFSNSNTETFTTVISNYVGGNNNNIVAKIVYNTAGNSNMTVTVNFADALFATVFYWDVDIGSSCTAAALDVHAGASTDTSNTGSISQTVTTASNNEGIITQVYQDSAGMTAATQPSGFSTTGGVVASYSKGGFEVVSSKLVGVNLSWTSISPSGASMDMFVISLAAPGTTACQNSVAVSGAGPC